MMTTTTRQTATLTTTTASTEEMLRDMAYVLRLTAKVSKDIQGSRELPIQPRLPRSVHVATSRV